MTAGLGNTAAPPSLGDSFPRLPETVTVYQPGPLDPEVEAVVAAAARRTGARMTVFRGGTVGLLRVTRGATVLQEAPPGLRFPMAAAAVDPVGAESLVGTGTAERLQLGQVVMGEASARLRGALAGDEIEIIGWDGEVHRFTVGAVVPDAAIGWAELVWSEETAASFGLSRKAWAVVWGNSDRRTVDRLLGSRLPDVLVTVRASTDPPDPDQVLPSALLKRRFGEFAYRPNGLGDRVVMDPAWEEVNIVWVELSRLGRFRCHRRVVAYVAAVLAQLEAEDLADQIDTDDFQANGGCYNPRLIRGGDKGGAVSRHAWGAALDINPTANPYGGQVEMSRQIVEAFHRWGFAWGGGWVYPDGGHFEWTHLPELLLVP